MTECNMVPGNRLELTSAADLAREEERISKKRALALFDTGMRANLKQGRLLHFKQFINICLTKSTTLPEKSEQ